MSIDRSLRTSNSLSRHRNVLTRAERIALLTEEGKWDASKGALGLPKVSHRKGKSGKQKDKAGAADGAEGDAAVEKK